MSRRFHTIPEVAESLATSEQQLRALLRTGDAKLDDYIERFYMDQGGTRR